MLELSVPLRRNPKSDMEAWPEQDDQMQYALALAHAMPSELWEPNPKPFRTQLLKWIGNKQRMAEDIIRFFPNRIRTYREPFLGSGGVLSVLAPAKAVGSDSFYPVIEIWIALRRHPDRLKKWYSDRWHFFHAGSRVEQYEKILASYNARANGADLLFLCRSCYGGVIRFRHADGYMSTPCGIHEPISPESFAHRVDMWHERVCGSEFLHLPYEDAFDAAERGDLIYCDPPYSYSQAILYGAQRFSLENLFDRIAKCKQRGVNVALSIDGSKKSGAEICALPIPRGLFERDIPVRVGRSMLRRFQLQGQTLESEVVHDRLLLTY
jgi:DNA adenine methylase